jgi:hypothetical protein
MRRLFMILAFVALGSLLAAAAAEAQQGGSAIRGRVTDEQRGVLPGVAIVVTHEERGTIRETVTGWARSSSRRRSPAAGFHDSFRLVRGWDSKRAL